MTTKKEEPKKPADQGEDIGAPREKKRNYDHFIGSGSGGTDADPNAKPSQANPNDALQVDEHGRSVRRARDPYKGKKPLYKGQKVVVLVEDVVNAGMLDPVVGRTLIENGFTEIGHARDALKNDYDMMVADLGLVRDADETARAMRYIDMSLQLAANYFVAQTSDAGRMVHEENFNTYKEYFARLGVEVQLDPADNSWERPVDTRDPDCIDVQTLTLAEAAQRQAFTEYGMNGRYVDELAKHESFNDCKTLKQLYDRFQELGEDMVMHVLTERKIPGVGPVMIGRIYADVIDTYERLEKDSYLPVPEGRSEHDIKAVARISIAPPSPKM